MTTAKVVAVAVTKVVGIKLTVDVVAEVVGTDNIALPMGRAVAVVMEEGEEGRFQILFNFFYHI